jgi:hypothetical protein
MTTCTTADPSSSISFQRKATALITVTAFTTLSALITIATFVALIEAAQPPL